MRKWQQNLLYFSFYLGCLSISFYRDVSHELYSFSKVKQNSLNLRDRRGSSHSPCSEFIILFFKTTTVCEGSAFVWWGVSPNLHCSRFGDTLLSEDTFKTRHQFTSHFFLLQKYKTQVILCLASCCILIF